MSEAFKTFGVTGQHDGAMPVDLLGASHFMTKNARLLDRRRFDLLVGAADAASVLAALGGYRNPDGGYGNGLEPDLRSPESQPGGALHAFEAFAEAAPHRTEHAVALCDWLATVSLDDGGMPFALPVTDPAGCAPFWAEADTTTSSLHITSAVVGMAQRVARFHPGVAEHPWLALATQYCLDAIAASDGPRHALELRFSLDFLDAIADTHPEAADHIERLGEAIPASGLLHVDGGLEDEMMRPLDFAPYPDRPARALFDDDVVAAELDRLAGLQDDDGGWSVDFTSYSPAAGLEWRGYITVWAMAILQGNGLVEPSGQASA
jgi:hypothetical protein